MLRVAIRPSRPILARKKENFHHSVCDFKTLCLQLGLWSVIKSITPQSIPALLMSDLLPK
ncbi:hypothetical protein PhaeoP71_03557 (plasmid) [Phaeobacter piscinae]|nr:hypothetical protein PhaeoP71_03557 [Phaeobacter piscinae]